MCRVYKNEELFSWDYFFSLKTSMSNSTRLRILPIDLTHIRSASLFDLPWGGAIGASQLLVHFIKPLGIFEWELRLAII